MVVRRPCGQGFQKAKGSRQPLVSNQTENVLACRLLAFLQEFMATIRDSEPRLSVKLVKLKILLLTPSKRQDHQGVLKARATPLYGSKPKREKQVTRLC